MVESGCSTSWLAGMPGSAALGLMVTILKLTCGCVLQIRERLSGKEPSRQIGERI